jgi:hypothetical protein
MQELLLVILAAGAIPCWRAWAANRTSSLSHAVAWAILTWISWTALAFFRTTAWTNYLDALHFVAICLTACSGVAVFGARNPGAGAWNLVVLGLFAVMMLPLAEQLILGTPSLGWVRLIFLAATIALVVLNYLPTCLGSAAGLLGISCALELSRLADPDGTAISDSLALGGLALVPWIAWLAWIVRSRPLSEFDRLWLDFRDRYGLVWAQRVREQFNRAAANAAWPVRLRWRGLDSDLGPTVANDEAVATLRALLKRFG